MKHITFFLIPLLLILFSAPVFCQEYINVELGSATKHDLVSNIDQITFSGSEVTFSLTGGGGTTESIADIVRITFGNTPLGDQSLPVELTIFQAVWDGSDVDLYWATASELNNRGFALERTHRNSDWAEIAFVDGAGSSSSQSSYQYCDENAGKYADLQYRLKQIDYDGSYEYSVVISPDVETDLLPDQFSISNNYPNPFNPLTRINYHLPKEDFVSVRIFDIDGREVQTLVDQDQPPGNYQLAFNAADLASGVYFCQISAGRQTKQIKMLLMK